MPVALLAQSHVSDESIIAFAVISFVYLILSWLVIRQRCSGSDLIGLGILTAVASAGYGSIVLPTGPLIAPTLIRIAFVLVLGGLIQQVFDRRPASGSGSVPAEKGEQS